MGEKSKKSKKAKMATMRIQLQANELFDKGKFDEAIVKLEEITPNNWTGIHFFNKSRFQLKNTNIEGAIESLRTFVNKDKTSAIGFFHLATLLFSTENYSEAQTCYESAYDSLRGNSLVDYRPLQLAVTLRVSDVAYNLAVAAVRNGNSDKFVKFIEIALENAEEIERHRDIRHLEALRESKLEEIPLTKFPMIEISPFAVFRVSQKVKTSLNSNPIKKATAKAVGGDGEAGFTPVAAPVIPKHFRASEMTDAPLSAKLQSVQRKENERQVSKGRSSSPTISALLAQSGLNLPGVDAAGRRAGISGTVGISRNPTPPSRPPPIAKENSKGSSGDKLSPKLSPKTSKLDLAEITKSVTKSVTKSLESRASSTQKLDKEERKTKIVPDGSLPAVKSTAKAVSVKSDKSKKSKKSSSKTKLSEDKSSVGPFPEGSGDQKIQCNDKKDEKRLEVKIPSESDGLNDKVRLCVNVQLDLDLEVERNSDLDTIMLRIRDRIHSIASIVSSNSTSPCLLHNGIVSN